MEEIIRFFKDECGAELLELAAYAGLFIVIAIVGLGTLRGGPCRDFFSYSNKSIWFLVLHWALIRRLSCSDYVRAAGNYNIIQESMPSTGYEHFKEIL